MTQTKLAIITGGSSGIGRAIARKVKDELDHRVISMSRRPPDTDIEHLHVDFSNTSALIKTLATLQTPPQILVLNAGIGLFGGLEQLSYHQIQSTINTNLVSQIYVLKHFLPSMKKTGECDVVIIGSEAAQQGARDGSVYCATKFALRGLAQSLRADCSRSDVRVILVNPGPVRTAFFDNLDFEPYAGQDFGLTPEDIAESVVHALRQNRHCVLDEINLQAIKRSFKKKEL